jgi:phosphoribosylformylglycinamidine (FGAM) synthase PurS component
MDVRSVRIKKKKSLRDPLTESVHQEKHIRVKKNILVLRVEDRYEFSDNVVRK